MLSGKLLQLKVGVGFLVEKSFTDRKKKHNIIKEKPKHYSLRSKSKIKFEHNFKYSYKFEITNHILRTIMTHAS